MPDQQKVQTYTEVTLDVPRQHCDAVCNYIIENIAHGVVLSEEEESPMVGITFYPADEIEGDYRSGLLTYLEQILGDNTVLPVIKERTVE
ncbi:MAG: hypothetical protein D6741_08770, partial [Planctomycetota bacterium]